jgi:hypothetical protein
MMAFAFAVGLVVVLLGNNPSALGQETQAQSPSAPPQLTTPFSEKELVPYKNKGTAAIAGQAFIATIGGVMYSPGGSVTLVPATEYTKDWFRKYVLEDGQGYCGPDEIDHERVKDECLNRVFASSLPPDKRINPYLRLARANPTGHFWFSKLPAGKYFIVAVITWGGGHLGAIIHELVEVEAGEQVANVVVTR